jgi:hypothetical protein
MKWIIFGSKEKKNLALFLAVEERGFTPLTIATESIPSIAYFKSLVSLLNRCTDYQEDKSSTCYKMSSHEV